MINFNMLVGYICYLIREAIDDVVLEQFVRDLPVDYQERIQTMVAKQYGHNDGNDVPVSMVEYQAMKGRMKNILEMLWPVNLEVEHNNRLLNIRYIVAAQPHPKTKNYWYLRLLNEEIICIKLTDGALEAMPRLAFKTHIKEFFKMQRKLLKEQRRWSPDLDARMHWQQVMIQTEVMPEGTVQSFSHEAFDAHQTGLYHLEDKRTRRTDYEWGKAGDPLDRHQKGKKTKAIIEGKIPVDIGKLTIGGVEFYPNMLKNPNGEKWLWKELQAMVEWGELPLDRVDYPEMFSSGARQVSRIFEVCWTRTEDEEEEERYKLFHDRMCNAKYWRVKDKKRAGKWWIYTVDPRLERRTFAHSVLPIGYIEPYRNKGAGEYLFVLLREESLAKLKNQSMFIADYSVVLTSDLCWKLGLKKSHKGDVLKLSAYNDWAAKVWRDLGHPGVPKLFTKDELKGVPIKVGCYAYDTTANEDPIRHSIPAWHFTGVLPEGSAAE
jgi:hypothetical protein